MSGLNIVVGVQMSFVTTLALDDGEILTPETMRAVIAEHLVNRIEAGGQIGAVDLIDDIEIIEVANGDDLAIVASWSRPT